MKFKLTVIGLTIAMMALRVRMTHVVVPSWVGTYEAFAHIFVGMMLGWWLAWRKDTGVAWQERRSWARLCWWLVIISTFLWEGPWFFIQQHFGR